MIKPVNDLSSCVPFICNTFLLFKITRKVNKYISHTVLPSTNTFQRQQLITSLECSYIHNH